MTEDETIALKVSELVKKHGAAAVDIARENMAEAIGSDDAKLAGFWMAVLYALEKQPSSQSH